MGFKEHKFHVQIYKGGFKFQVQHFLKGDKVLYFNVFDDCGNIGREYDRGDSPIQPGPWKPLKIYEPPDSKCHELPVALRVRT
jgi:hypothetical protein